MLTKNEKDQLRRLIESPHWAAVELLANKLCDKLKDDNVVREDQWSTLKELLTREGQVRGIRLLLQEIYANAQNNV